MALVSILFLAICSTHSVLAQDDTQTTMVPKSPTVTCIETREIINNRSNQKCANCENKHVTDFNIATLVTTLDPGVVKLNLANNFLVKLNFSQFAPLKSLTVLNVSDNKITEVVGHQNDIPTALEEVDYSGNKLKSITPSMIPLRSKKLALSRNRIDHIGGDAFGGVAATYLRSLDLSHNTLYSIMDTKEGVLDTPKLEILNLSGNRLSTYFNDDQKPMVAFSKLQNLTMLDLSFNSLKRIYAADMQYLEKLIYLDLSHNGFEEMDGFSFKALTLRKRGKPYIWQQGRYKWWFLEGKGLLSIATLDLSYNHIRHIDVELMHQLTNLIRVDLSNNWYHCDGDLYFAVYVMKRHRFVNATLAKINQTDAYVCYSPTDIGGTRIYDFRCSGPCEQRFEELRRHFDEEQGFVDSKENLTGSNIALIIGASIFGIFVLLLFLWALRNGLVHRFCHVCLTKMSTAPPRNVRLGNTRAEMRAGFAQLDQLETEAEVY